jgi:hypothetical protein
MEYKQIIQNALDILKKQLEKHLELKLRDCYGDEFYVYLENGPKVNPNNMMDKNLYNSKTKYKDVLYYLNAFIKNWEFPFKNSFNNNITLTLCHSIKYFRNRWAHQSLFSVRETYRLIDECQALLEELQLDHSEIDVIRKSVLELLANEEVKSDKLGTTPKIDPIVNIKPQNNVYVNPNNNTNLNSGGGSSGNNVGLNVFPSNNSGGSYIGFPSGNNNSNNNWSNNAYAEPFNYDDEFMIDVDDINDKELLNDIKAQKQIFEQLDKSNSYK